MRQANKSLHDEHYRCAQAKGLCLGVFAYSMLNKTFNYPQHLDTCSVDVVGTCIPPQVNALRYLGRMAGGFPRISSISYISAPHACSQLQV